MSERSLVAFEHYREAEQKFEYFLAGVSVAVCGYIGQTLKPERFALSPYSLEIVALLVIAASVVIGFRRMENYVLSRQLNHDALHNREILGHLSGFVSGDLVPPFTTDYGEYFASAEAVTNKMIEAKRVVLAREKQMQDVAARLVSLYRWRNRLLLVGFLLLVGAKAWAPYYGAP